MTKSSYRTFCMSMSCVEYRMIYVSMVEPIPGRFVFFYVITVIRALFALLGKTLRSLSSIHSIRSQVGPKLPFQQFSEQNYQAHSQFDRQFIIGDGLYFHLNQTLSYSN